MKCGIYGCFSGKTEDRPNDCPSASASAEDVMKEYEGDCLRMAQVAAEVEAEGYMRWTRLEELMEFSRRMGFKRLGIASCIGLKKESISLARILESRGFEVEGVFCKVGGVHKERIGLSRDKMLRKEGFEAMCNPVAQARLLNAAGTDLNVIMGLCVGHDIIFSQRSRAPVTTLVVKDRVLGHNPVAAIYGAEGFYRRVYGRKDDKK
ncbi:MAG TPA: DUF1847 domain-containing protein [Candidatus Methanomethylicus sp.]|nr:DUF1847 domain-containing protein [Candidatus Methanomethylicus sp.]